jgi:glutamate synthase (ferredoxin)
VSFCCSCGGVAFCRFLTINRQSNTQTNTPTPHPHPKHKNKKGDKTLGTKTFGLSFAVGQAGAMEHALAKLCADVEAAVRAGCQCVVLTDRPAGTALDAAKAPIPSLLATGAVHHHLIRAGLRSDTSIVVDTAQAFSTHHAAVLIGYGAHAVCPYLAYETARQWRLSSRTQSLIKTGKVPDVSIEAAQGNLKKSLEKGILKIMSKMGISLLSCYHGAQIFEAYGLGRQIVDLAFTGSVSRIGGLSLNDLQREAESSWAKGFPQAAMTKLDDYGFIQSRPKGEYHANNQTMAKLLHKAIGLGQGSAADPESYEAYKRHFAEAPVHVLRDCLELAPPEGARPISVDEVEPAAAIMARFCTGGMSLGAISRETHETIAIAMNRIGGKSNSGEGGEDPVRWTELGDATGDGKSATFPYLRGLENGDTATSKIKQVASGRFGVTPEFIANADQLEIKVAQGAKPGEGGQLPGQKVSPYIAGLRRSKPGVPLISPPPHHDIYSIEDLAQLIYDLHQANPQAKVSVKLVAEAGIGVVASGVAKANADIIQISGHDGGTGASPISSIKHAGGPMEMGVAETHQTLVRNELRERVVLRADGGMRNGRDVLMAAALGADEYGFGTVAMIATGCIMARVCHTNNCPVGVASQREELRARFPGAPADLVNYFHFVAEEVRAGLAALGLRSLDELVGRSDLLRQRADLKLAKTAGLNLAFLTTFAGPSAPSSARLAQEVHSNGPQLDDEILADAEVMAAIEGQGTAARSYEIINTDRSALARVSGAIAKRYGDSGFGGAFF